MDYPEGDIYWQTRPFDDVRKDWKDNADWISGYWNSRIHPHRMLILDALRNVEFESLLEVGCNCGPNLAAIQERFPSVKLAGIDINEDSIKEGRQLLEDVELKVGNADALPFADKSFDVILSDAVLLYIEPERIRQVLKEFLRVARKGIVLCEWGSSSLLGEIQHFHWARDYKKLLEELGLKVTKKKITKDYWSNTNWLTHGWIFIARFRAQ